MNQTLKNSVRAARENNPWDGMSMDYRILAAGELRDNNTRRTGLNNNDLIIGPSGSGKTRYYMLPNFLQCNGSVVVTDTKGNLQHIVGPDLKARGYRVLSIDFADLSSSAPGACGYNPLDYIRFNKKTGRWSEQDIQTIATALVPIESRTDLFWDQSAQMYVACMIAYTMECLPPEERHLGSVVQLFRWMDYDRSKPHASFETDSKFGRLLTELGEQNPDSCAWRMYCSFKGNATAEKMHESIRGILSAKLNPLVFDGAMGLYTDKNRVHFPDLGREKTALFLTVSDADRSQDRLINLFYMQAFQSLIYSADRDYPDCRLPVPVRFMLDDFATGTVIPDFDNLTSVIRSREISVSIIIQSLTQLEALYGEAKATTIVNNCDNCLYLGGQDTNTARKLADKIGRTANSILTMPLDSAYLFTRGQPAKLVSKYDLSSHPRYHVLPEAAKEDTAARCAGF